MKRRKGWLAALLAMVLIVANFPAMTRAEESGGVQAPKATIRFAFRDWCDTSSVDVSVGESDPIHLDGSNGEMLDFELTDAAQTINVVLNGAKKDSEPRYTFGVETDWESCTEMTKDGEVYKASIELPAISAEENPDYYEFHVWWSEDHFDFEHFGKDGYTKVLLSMSDKITGLYGIFL